MDLDRIVAILLATLLMGTPALGQSPSVSLTEVERAYDSLQGLRAAFTQSITSEFAGDTTAVTGTVILSGNQYRVQTDQQTIVTNGTTTWIYTPTDSQVVVNDAGSEASTVTPKTFLSSSSERYEIVSSANTRRLDAPHVRLNVTATDSSARFQDAALWVRTSDHILTRMKATDRNGSTLDLRLQNVEPNPALDDSTFHFSPPPGAEVIDLRSSE